MTCHLRLGESDAGRALGIRWSLQTIAGLLHAGSKNPSSCPQLLCHPPGSSTVVRHRQHPERDLEKMQRMSTSGSASAMLLSRKEAVLPALDSIWTGRFLPYFLRNFRPSISKIIVSTIPMRLLSNNSFVKLIRLVAPILSFPSNFVRCTPVSVSYEGKEMLHTRLG